MMDDTFDPMTDPTCLAYIRESERDWAVLNELARAQDQRLKRLRADLAEADNGGRVDEAQTAWLRKHHDDLEVALSLRDCGVQIEPDEAEELPLSPNTGG